jgi:hypothetical protein
VGPTRSENSWSWRAFLVLSQLIGEFDLVNLNNRTRNDLERIWRNIVGDSDDEDDEFDGFNPEDAYVVPEFVNWDKTRNARQLHELYLFMKTL